MSCQVLPSPDTPHRLCHEAAGLYPTSGASASRTQMSSASAFCTTGCARMTRFFAPISPIPGTDRICSQNLMAILQLSGGNVPRLRDLFSLVPHFRIPRGHGDYRITPVESAASAPVAQLDRASGFEPEGREFESLRARHINQIPSAPGQRLQCYATRECPPAIYRPASARPFPTGPPRLRPRCTCNALPLATHHPTSARPRPTRPLPPPPARSI